MNTKNTGSEITLIDLVVVVLRYWRMILLVTLIPTLIIVAYFLVSGSLMPEKKEPAMAEAQATIYSGQIPPDLKPFIPVDIDFLLMESLKSRKNIDAALARVYAAGDETKSGSASDAPSGPPMEGRSLSVVDDPKSNRFDISCKGSDPKRAAAFIHELVSIARSETRGRILGVAEEYLKIGQDDARASGLEIKDMILDGKTFPLRNSVGMMRLDASYPAFLLKESVEGPDANTSMKFSSVNVVFLVFFSSLFLANLLAFFRDYLKRLLEDQSEMKKLKTIGRKAD